MIEYDIKKIDDEDMQEEYKFFFEDLAESLAKTIK